MRWVEEEAYVDLLVDGKSVLELIPDVADRITPLAKRWLREPVLERAAAFLGQRENASPLGPDQIELAVCPQCGDLGCGGVIARLTVTDTEVVWEDVQWTLDRENEFDELPAPEPLAQAFPARIVFDRKQYEAALSSALEMLATGPWCVPPPSESWNRRLRRLLGFARQ
ncbi:hypothetical protein [Zafaria cholistanensis]|uniref:hypothetical protein n=1 Tax=Zafaria cholistanensis TaxID=1682741 RepID=UPI00155B2548|nr:hypothetical protein [Zafaria cholistanensis]